MWWLLLLLGIWSFVIQAMIAPSTLRWFCPRGQFWISRINNNIVFALYFYCIYIFLFGVLTFVLLMFVSPLYLLYCNWIACICIVLIGLANCVRNDVFRNIRIITLFSSQMGVHWYPVIFIKHPYSRSGLLVDHWPFVL